MNPFREAATEAVPVRRSSPKKEANVVEQIMELEKNLDVMAPVSPSLASTLPPKKKQKTTPPPQRVPCSIRAAASSKYHAEPHEQEQDSQDQLAGFQDARIGRRRASRATASTSGCRFSFKSHYITNPCHQETEPVSAVVRFATALQCNSRRQVRLTQPFVPEGQNPYRRWLKSTMCPLMLR